MVIQPVKNDIGYMKMALQLAKSSRPSPNPRVGAIIVKNDRVIGKGYHVAPGLPHAEIEAINDATKSGEDVSGATIFVTLEPCCHYGRTGPCATALHLSGISRIVVGMEDPDPLVSGKGIESLRLNGHTVDVGVLENECAEMLDTYIQHRKLKRPLVHMKAAISLDGFIATTNGSSKWITSDAARTKGHELRAKHDAILVGIGTVLCDDPILTVRHVAGPNPTRIVLDTHLRIPLNAKIIQSANEAGVVVFHGPEISPEKKHLLEIVDGVNLIECPVYNNKLDVNAVIERLNELGFLSVLVEGGSTIHGTFISSQLANRLSLFISPKIFGVGIPWAGMPGCVDVQNAIHLNPHSIQICQIECDTLIEGNFDFDRSSSRT